jgi:hypothetical protein
MNFTGSLAAGVTITFTAAEKDIIQRGLKRELKRRADLSITPVQTGAQIFTESLKAAIESIVRGYLQRDREAVLTPAEQTQVDSIFATAAEREVSGVPLTLKMSKARKKLGKKKR